MIRRSGSRRPESKTLLLGHADEPELLEHNLAHHFSIGFDNVVVVTVSADEIASKIVARFDRRRAFHYVLEENGGDLFNFFTEPARFAAIQLGASWIAVCDTDEFIVSRFGTIATTPAMRASDLVAISRYTALPQGRDADSLLSFDFSQPQHIPVAAEYVDIKRAWLAGDRSLPYIMGKDAPKVMARTSVVEGVLPGGHGVVTARPFATRSVDADLAIVHVPFSTLLRFERKIVAIHEIFSRYADRFGPEDAWHWRSWMGLDGPGIRREFEAQIRAPDAPGAGETVEKILTRSFLRVPPVGPDSFATLKTIVQYVEPVIAHDIPKWLDLVFDERWYAEQNEDVRAGAERGTVDAREHFLTIGIVEGRSPSATFDPHFVRRELERVMQNYLELRDVYWLYFAMAVADRPPMQSQS